jgi:hypothetical protein
MAKMNYPMIKKKEAEATVSITVGSREKKAK